MNTTQALLEAAGERRAYAGLIAVAETRESILPIERRRLHKLARLVSLTPIDPPHLTVGSIAISSLLRSRG